MRLMAIGKWSKEQRRWLTVVALTRNSGGRPGGKRTKPGRPPTSSKK